MDYSGMSGVAGLLAEPSRAAICAALLDGRAWTVGELASAAGVSKSTASEHVSALEGGRLVERIRQGRHVYVRIVDPGVAELLERLAAFSVPVKPTSLRGTHQLNRLARARTCYDHLAGSLGVRLRDGMIQLGFVDLSDGVRLTAAGRETLAQLGIATPATTHRAELKNCLDWTERREHLAGAVPNAILAHAVSTGWLTRRPDRSVLVDTSAVTPLSRLGVDAEELASMNRSQSA